MFKRSQIRTLGLVLFLAFSAAPNVWGAERERLEFGVGFHYDQGDFGSGIESKTFFMPFSLRYFADRFDLGLTIPFVYQDSSESVTLVDGEVQRVREENTIADSLTDIAPGIGDVSLKARIYFLDDPGLGSPLPGISPFVKVKFPTADESDGLGTGEFDYGLGLELDKSLYDFFVFTDASYTFIGDPPGRNLRDRISAGGGLGYSFSRDLSASASIGWSRSLVRRAEDPLDLFFNLRWRITPKWVLTPVASVGLSDGSPDFGFGLRIAYRFFRF